MGLLKQDILPTGLARLPSGCLYLAKLYGLQHSRTEIHIVQLRLIELNLLQSRPQIGQCMRPMRAAGWCGGAS